MSSDTADTNVVSTTPLSLPNSQPQTLESIQSQLRTFASDRNWDQFHTPRNLLLAMVGEVGELAEIFQWRDVTEGLPELEEEEKIHVGEEVADVLMYLLRFADKCGVDVSKAVGDKMEKNGLKYPVEKCYGKYKKS